jgi:hypothetical protein
VNHRIQTSVGILLLLPVLSFTAGCGGSGRAEAPDPEFARQTLCLVLDAWEDGESTESLRQRSPAIYVNDQDWQEGKSLSAYQLIGKEHTVGAGLRCEVQLSLKDARGKIRKKKAMYSVQTSQALSVSREDDR